MVSKVSTVDQEAEERRKTKRTLTLTDDVLDTLQKPANQSILAEKSGPPAWKQLPTWYEVSENDRMIPPDAEPQFAKQINATTISLNSSHASMVSHPKEIAELILDAAKATRE